jgi:hypothetical protein
MAVAFVPDGQPPVSEQPGDGPLDLVAVPAEAFAGFDAAAGDARHDAPAAQPGTQVAVVVAFVGACLVRLAAAGAAPRADRRNRQNSGCRACLSWVLAAETAVANGSPAPSDSTWILLPDLPRSTGFGPVSGPPLGADGGGVHDRRRPVDLCPRTPSSSSTARCNRGHSPASVHAWNRRCAVWYETPNSPGRCRHAHPLVSTYTIAVNTARSSTGAVPPPWLRALNCGISGAASSHNSSGTSRFPRSDTTAHDHLEPCL